MFVEVHPRNLLSLAYRFTSLCLKLLLQSLLPARCLSCRILVSEAHQLCAACWNALDFIEEPFCSCCGFPFDVELESAMQCGRCVLRSSVFDGCRSVLAYNEASKRLILQLKHADRIEGIPFFACLLEKTARSYGETIDLIVPVPLHWTRLWLRQYNQAALLALPLGKRMNIPVDPCALKRHRRTPSHGVLSAKRRESAMRGAFSISKNARARLRGKIILLIDDVYTTGATLNACARALKKAKAKKIIALTLARTLKGR